MSRFDDEILMAYADGCLTPRDRQLVQAELSRDPASCRSIMIFKSTAALARHAFEAPMWCQPPRRLVETIERQRASPAGSLAKRVRLLSRPALAGVAAASLAAFLLLVVSGPWVGGPPRIWPGRDSARDLDITLGEVARDTELARALDALARRGDVEQRFKLVATLTDRWGNWCQRVDARAQAREAAPAALIACRAPTGRWNVIAAVAPHSAIDESRLEPYSRSGAAAQDALAGVLSVIGALDGASNTAPAKEKTPQ